MTILSLIFQSSIYYTFFYKDDKDNVKREGSAKKGKGVPKKGVPKKSISSLPSHLNNNIYLDIIIKPYANESLPSVTHSNLNLHKDKNIMIYLP